ncbi:nicotinamide N-methyltransferase-like [Hyperolius riggenbachi]|uniref:nicotinamide N-methyltransferase-like n=1 Tax=Hyperolius riggenbachi TaxID=752182 RepID=UPI0035A3846A
MSDFSSQEEYQKHFDPKTYLAMYFTMTINSKENQYLQFVLPHLAQIFNSGEVKGDTLIDIGTGPTIYQLLSACEAFKNITVSDLADRNREEFKAWLTNEPGAFDWSPVVKHVCQLEGDKISWTEKEAHLRKSIKQVLRCDVLKCNPMDPVVLSQADCLLSTVCLETACKDLETQVTALKNISTLLKPGGHLVIVFTLECPYYMVGDVKFSYLFMTEACVRESLSKAGYVIEKFEMSKNSDHFWEPSAKLASHLVVVARKNT